jgi:hypothetical protein
MTCEISLGFTLQLALISVQLVPLQPIFISILFHHYKQLTELMAQVEQMEAKGRKGKEAAAEERPY